MSPTLADIDESLLKSRDAYRVPGSHLNHVAAETARKMGLENPIEVFVSRSKAIQAEMVPLAKGMRVIITEPMLQAMGGSPHGHVPAEIKAIIGHELGHVKEGGYLPYFYGGKLPILALPAVAIMARHYIERAHEKQLTREQAADYIQHDADKEHDPLPYETDAPHTPLEKGMITLGKDLSVGALGLIGGSFVAKLNSNLLEHRCDRWAARVTNPQAVINTFQKMDAAYEMRALKGIRTPASDPYKFGETKTLIGKLYKIFIHSTITSHPSHADRIEYLEKLAAKGLSRL